MKRTIVITGGAGYIGSHVAYLLASNGYHVVIFDSAQHGPPILEWADHMRKDFTDSAALDEVFGNFAVEAVIHCAGIQDQQQSLADPARYYQINVAKTLILLDKMRYYQINNFIFSSSASVYGALPSTVLSETAPLNPVTPYAHSKAMIEQIVRDYAQSYNFCYVILRLFQVAGTTPELCLADQWLTNSTSTIISRALRAMYLGQELTLSCEVEGTKDGTYQQDYLHVRDAANLYYLALKHIEETGVSDCFNVGSGIGYTEQEVVEEIIRIYDKQLPLCYKEPNSYKMPSCIADIHKAQTLLAWKPKYSNLAFLIKSSFEYKDAHSLSQIHIQESKVR